VIAEISAERSMPKSGCRHCLCPEVEPCRFYPGELLLLFVLRRPAVCAHCRQRQYTLPFVLSALVRLVTGSRRTELRYRR
jgi:hypothetical protein